MADFQLNGGVRRKHARAPLSSLARTRERASAPGRRRARVAVHCALLCALLCACTRGALPESQLGSASPARAGATTPPVVLPQASAFETTPTPEPVRGDASDAALIEGVTRAAQSHALTLDGRLADLALAIALASDGARKPPSYPLVRYHAHRAGLAEPTPQVWLASGPSAEALLPSLSQALDDATRSSRLTHCGAAAVQLERGVVVALALSTRAFTLHRPVPRSVAVGARVLLEGQLARDYHAPALAVTDPQGAVTRHALGPARTFSRALVADRAGENTLELLATGPEGLAVIAVLPVLAGAAVPDQPPSVDAAPVERDARAVAEHLLEAIARERALLKLAPLKRDPRLAKIALAHSEDMVEHGFIAHSSKRTGDATARVRTAGLDALLVLENIGRGYSAAELHRGLMESPGHRGNILHPDAREIGIGVVAEREGDRDAFIVTELFTQLVGRK
jgi:uncharacterized protein YkwD